MRRVAFRCDGAPLPRAWQGESWEEQAINRRGAHADLNLLLQNLSDAVLGQVSARAADLVRIAAYVYAADQSVSRGGSADVYGTHWRRHLALSIPVSDCDYWSQPTVIGRLRALLAFLSEDQWEFAFAEGGPDFGRLPFGLSKQAVHALPDAVILFSGGADSLCATVEAVVAGGARPVLVSHRSNPQLGARLRDLVHELRRR